MNWGHRLKKLVTRNWREKIISLVLAFLLWFMIKAQDVRHTPMYTMPPPSMLPGSTPAPAQLAPVLPPSSAPVPSQLDAVVPAPVLPPAPGTEGVGAAATASGL